MRPIFSTLILLVGITPANATSLACAFQFPDGHFVGYNFDFVWQFII